MPHDQTSTAAEPARSDAIGILHRAKQSAKVLFNLRRLPKPLSLEEQVYAEVVRDGDVCFDIGANVGWIALFLARTAGPTGKVIAFEPVWPTYMTMCVNIQNTINVKAPILTMPFGLAEEEKAATIHVPDGRFEFGTLVQPDELTRLYPQMRLAHGYNVLAHVPERHAERIRGLKRLGFGTGRARTVARGLYPNRPLQF